MQVIFLMLQTLDFLSEKGIVHGCVTPENVMFNSGRVAKLTGFEHACQQGSWIREDSALCFKYLPPEVISATNGYRAHHKATSLL